MRTGSNGSKLDAVKTMLRVIAPVFSGTKKIFTLVDSRYMKWPYLEYVLALGYHAIGQVRRDTALYGIPVLSGKRGHPESMATNSHKKLLLLCRNIGRRFSLTVSGSGYDIKVPYAWLSLCKVTKSVWYKCNLKMRLAN